MAGSIRKAALLNAGEPENVRLDSTELIYFAAVAQELSFNRAAQSLAIDPSWLSAKVRRLEKQLRRRLFVRTTRRVELSEEGRKLLEPALALLRAVGEANRLASAIVKGSAGCLRVGALHYSFRKHVEYSLVDRFMELFPEVEVTIENGSSPELLQRLRSGGLDVAVVSWPFQTQGLDYLLVRRDHYYVAIPNELAQANLQNPILSDLRGCRMTMPAPEYNESTFELLFKPFVDAGIQPVFAPQFQSDALYRLARETRTLALCREENSSEFEDFGFTVRDLAGFPMFNDKFLVRATHSANAATDMLWNLAQSA